MLTWSSLIPPGSNVTSAAAIVFEILNVLESIIFTLPAVPGVGVVCDHGKEKGSGAFPSSPGEIGGGGVDGKMYRSFAGIWANADASAMKFLSRTSMGMCDNQSVRRNVSSSLKLPLSSTLQPMRQETDCHFIGWTNQKEFGPISGIVCCLQWVRNARREIPNVTLFLENAWLKRINPSRWRRGLTTSAT